MSLHGHLRDLAEESVTKFYLGDISVKIKSKKKQLTLGDVIAELKNFTFPRKDEYIQLLNNINSARKPIVHHLAKLSSDDLLTVDKAIDKICCYTEELVNLSDLIIIEDIPNIITVLDISGNKSKK